MFPWKTWSPSFSYAWLCGRAFFLLQRSPSQTRLTAMTSPLITMCSIASAPLIMVRKGVLRNRPFIRKMRERCRSFTLKSRQAWSSFVQKEQWNYQTASNYENEMYFFVLFAGDMFLFISEETAHPNLWKTTRRKLYVFKSSYSYFWSG